MGAMAFCLPAAIKRIVPMLFISMLFISMLFIRRRRPHDAGDARQLGDPARRLSGREQLLQHRVAVAFQLGAADAGDARELV